MTAKPTLYVCNVSEDEFLAGKSEMADKVAALAKSENNLSLQICSQMEAEISQLDPSERGEFLASMGIKEPGLNRLIREAYALLNLITYFTAGEKEVRAWPFEKGSTAPQCAGIIHTDFERGFIKAEVIGYDDYVVAGSEKAAKEKGTMRLEGKEYVMADGDIVHFRFNV